MRKGFFNEATFSLAGYGARLGLRREGITVAEEIWRALARVKRPGVLRVELGGIEVLSGSFADAALAGPLSRLVEGALPERYMYVAAPDPEVVEDLGTKLEQRNLAMIALLPGTWDTLGYLSPSLREALSLVVDRGETTSAELAEALGISPKAAAVRLKELAKGKLIHLASEPRPVGGIQRRAISFILPSR
jgi:DNA-binding transcriptional ArsR family regulator